MQDSTLVSLIIGRYGAAIWGLIALALSKWGIEFTDAETSQIMTGVSAAVSVGLIIVSRLRGGMKAKAMQAKNEEAKEPPSIIGNSGMSKLDTMTALSILVILASLLVGYGCIKPVMKQDVAERIAVSFSAKALGQKLQGDFKWTPQMDAFVAVIEADGITLSTGQMAHNYLMPRIPALYHREARIIFESVGFEFSGDSVSSVSRVDKGILLEAVGAFKDGLAFR